LPHGWVSPWHFGINEGPIVAMIENYKSGLVWQLMRECPYVVAGLRAAGFTGGWLHDAHPYGFKASFNPTWSGPSPGGWVSPYFFGLNLGPIVLMVENHRNGMLWKLMRGCRAIVDGLRRAGFDGGWLDAAAGRRAS
jgi:hypothetical protein